MRNAFLFVFATVFLFCAPVLAEELTGKVVGIADGDTVTVLTPQMEEIKVRLAGIDAPEKDQPYGQKSKQMLSDLIYNRTVRVEKEDIDKYGRTVGHIYLGNTDINILMISQGGAWAYKQYLGPKDTAFVDAEEAARKDSAGLWALQADQITPPWEFRHKDNVSQNVVSSDPLFEPIPMPVYLEEANDNPPPAVAQTYQPEPEPASSGRACCKHCSKGVPCGNSCISASKTCHQPPGCAC